MGRCRWLRCSAHVLTDQPNGMQLQRRLATVTGGAPSGAEANDTHVTVPGRPEQSCPATAKPQFRPALARARAFPSAASATG